MLGVKSSKISPVEKVNRQKGIYKITTEQCYDIGTICAQNDYGNKKRSPLTHEIRIDFNQTNLPLRGYSITDEQLYQIYVIVSKQKKINDLDYTISITLLNDGIKKIATTLFILSDGQQPISTQSECCISGIRYDEEKNIYYATLDGNISSKPFFIASTTLTRVNHQIERKIPTRLVTGDGQAISIIPNQQTEATLREFIRLDGPQLIKKLIQEKKSVITEVKESLQQSTQMQISNLDTTLDIYGIVDTYELNCCDTTRNNHKFFIIPSLFKTLQDIIRRRKNITITVANNDNHTLTLGCKPSMVPTICKVIEEPKIETRKNSITRVIVPEKPSEELPFHIEGIQKKEEECYTLVIKQKSDNIITWEFPTDYATLTKIYHLLYSNKRIQITRGREANNTLMNFIIERIPNNPYDVENHNQDLTKLRLALGIK